MSPVISLKIDDLPAPLRPMIPHRSPSATVKVTFLNSSVAPKETPTLESERRVTLRQEKTEEARARDATRHRKAKRLPHLSHAFAEFSSDSFGFSSRPPARAG